MRYIFGMSGSILLILLLLLVTTFVDTPRAALGQEKPSYDLAAAARGENAFKAYCVSCHGQAARGDGPLAKELKVRPPDLTLIASRNGGEFPVGQVAKRIDGREPVKGHGSKDMPAWGEAFQITDGSEGAKQKVNEVAHYLWSIQRAGK